MRALRPPRPSRIQISGSSVSAASSASVDVPRPQLVELLAGECLPGRLRDPPPVGIAARAAPSSPAGSWRSRAPRARPRPPSLASCTVHLRDPARSLPVAARSPGPAGGAPRRAGRRGAARPLSPVACNMTVSFVLICPSTVMRSNESATAARSAASGFWISASVCTKQSIVAKPGSIIPAPFAWAESVTPSTTRVQALAQRSVVMIASANPPPPAASSCLAASSMPRRTSSSGSGTPMTPVSATATAGPSSPSATAAASRIARASAYP